MPRALLVNPETRTVSAITIDTASGEKEMQAIQDLLQCHYFESAPQLFARTQTLVPDTFSEEISDQVNGKTHIRKQFRVPGRILGPISGNMLVVGESNGEVVDCHVKPEQLKALITWDN